MTDGKPKVWLGPRCLDESEPKLERVAADLAEALASVPNWTLGPEENEEDRARAQDSLGRAYTSLWDVLQLYKEERRATREARDEFLNEALANLKDHERALAEEQRENLKGRLLLKLERLGGVKEALAGGEMNAVLAASPPARAALMALFEHAGQAENVPPSEVRRRVDSGEWTTETIGRLPDTWIKPARLVTLACFCFWPAVLHEWRRDNAGNIAARWAIGKLGDNPLANRPDARSRLQAEVDRLLPGARAACGLDNAEAEPAENLGPLVADWLEQAGFTRTAESIRSNPPAPDLWAGPVSFAKDLALAVWNERIAPELAELEHRRLKDCPAIRRPIAQVLALPAERIVHGARSLRLLGSDWRLNIPAVAALDVARGAMDCERLHRAVVVVASYLVSKGHEQWLNRSNEDRHEFVTIPCGRNATRQTLGAELTEDEIDGALDWLEGFTVAGWSCCETVDGEAVPAREGKSPGGRKARIRMVRLGPPLAPQGIEKAYEQQGVKLPKELAWLTPVLPVTHMPTVGNKATLALRQIAFAFGLGVILIDLRTEYAERGLRPSELRPHLKRAGLYHRSHKSLVEDFMNELQTEPPRALLPGFPRGAVLAETAPGSGYLRFGPDYEVQHRFILRAAGKTKEGLEKYRRGQERKARRKGPK